MMAFSGSMVNPIKQKITQKSRNYREHELLENTTSQECESGGRCLFVMAEKTVGGKDVRRQLMEKTGIRYG